MGSDRLDWIFDAEHAASMGERYDNWADTYDADHDEWGWRGPDMVADATFRHLGAFGANALVVDAGCGTGMAGVALRKAGWNGRIVGLDLSHAMVARAATSGAYDDLILCSLYDVPLADGCVDAIVSSGVFTVGHVGGEALAELCRIARPGGVISVTQRTDVADRFASHIRALRSAGVWDEVARTEPERLHPVRDDTEQTVVTWKIRASESA